jgi:hypothetical protein
MTLTPNPGPFPDLSISYFDFGRSGTVTTDRWILMRPKKLLVISLRTRI